MKRLGKWFLLLNKRLYKKVTFLLILLLIPTLVFGYGKLAQEDRGVLTVALAQRGDDPMALEIMEELGDSSALVRFVFCDTEEQAEQMVNDSKADAAWIFADDLENAIYRFVQNPSKSTAFVQIIEGQSSVPLKLAREKLSESVFSRCSRAFYLQYLRENVPQLDSMSDEAVLKYYDEFTADSEIFVFSNLEGTVDGDDAISTNYLMTPVRGLLSVVIVLGGLAATLFYIADEKAGTFALVPQNRRWAVEFACQMIGVLNVGIVSLLSLLLAGLGVNFGREVVLLVLNSVAVSLFCMNVRRLCGSMAGVGTVLPLLVVAMLAIGPVFFDFGGFPRYLFPPTYYVYGAYSNSFLLQLLLYIVFLGILYCLLGKVLKRREVK